MMSEISVNHTFTITLTLSREEAINLLSVLEYGAVSVKAGWASLDKNAQAASQQALFIAEPLRREIYR